MEFPGKVVLPDLAAGAAICGHQSAASTDGKYQLSIGSRSTPRAIALTVRKTTTERKEPDLPAVLGTHGQQPFITILIQRIELVSTYDDPGIAGSKGAPPDFGGAAFRPASPQACLGADSVSADAPPLGPVLTSLK